MNITLSKNNHALRWKIRLMMSTKEKIDEYFGILTEDEAFISQNVHSKGKNLVVRITFCTYEYCSIVLYTTEKMSLLDIIVYKDNLKKSFFLWFYKTNYKYN